MRAITELSDAEIDALRPCDVLLLIMHAAVRKGDLPLALDAAAALAPYRHRQMAAKPWIDYAAGDGIPNLGTGNHHDRNH